MNIWIQLKTFASFIETDSRNIFLYQRKRNKTIGVYIKDIKDISCQLCAEDSAYEKPMFFIESSNFAEIGHQLYIRIPYDNIRSMNRVQDEPRQLIPLWQEEN